jgi:hypothetical protein
MLQMKVIFLEEMQGGEMQHCIDGAFEFIGLR